MAVGVGLSIFRHTGEQPSSEKLVQAMDRTSDRGKKNYARRTFKNRIFSDVGVLAYFFSPWRTKYAEIVLVGNSALT